MSKEEALIQAIGSGNLVVHYVDWTGMFFMVILVIGCRAAWKYATKRDD